jgi:hypothetical protein
VRGKKRGVRRNGVDGVKAGNYATGIRLREILKSSSLHVNCKNSQVPRKDIPLQPCPPFPPRVNPFFHSSWRDFTHDLTVESSAFHYYKTCIYI